VQSPIVAHHKVTVETDEQRHQRRVDALEPEIATDDVTDATLIGTGHADNIPQNCLRQETTKHAQGKDGQQMNPCLPLPYFESEGLEDGECQYHEKTTDNPNPECFFVTFVHTVCKGTKKMRNVR